MSDLIGYEALTQKAMRGVVRDTLEQVKQNGAIPGDHHFYISFKTKAFGVKIPKPLMARFPDVMTIVIQFQYWDLEVTDRHFEIVLKFGGVPQHLSVPFSAITRFVDPSVNFGLSFEEAELELVENEATESVVEGDETADASTTEPVEKKETAGTIVRLDAFRQKKG